MEGAGAALALALPRGFAARPARSGDAAAVAAVIAADELRHLGAAETTAAQVAADWGGADLDEYSVVVEDGTGRVVAAGDAVPSRAELLMAYGYVHPAFTGRGLGAFLVGFFEERARRLAAPVGAAARVRHYLPEANLAARGLLAADGYQVVRAILRMERELEAPPPPPRWPEGVTVRDYRGAADEPAAYEAFELGSAGMWGRPGNDFAQWAPRAASYDPALFKLAEANGAIVGISIAAAPAGGAGGAAEDPSQTEDPAQGVVEGAAAGAGDVAAGGDRRGHLPSLRVVPEWRRRGLGAALLANAFADLHARGARSVSLTVDSASPAGAPRLYQAAGMRVTRRYLVLERQLCD